MIAKKQNTSIYKEGLVFSNDPISTGNKVVFLPKPINKYDTCFDDYEKKKETIKLSRQEKAHQWKLENDPHYLLENSKKFKMPSAKSSTITYSSSQKSMPSHLTVKSSKKSEPINYWQNDPFKTTKHMNKSTTHFEPREESESNIFCTHTDWAKRTVDHVRPVDKPPVWGNSKNAPLWTMGDATFYGKQDPPKGTNYFF